MNSTPISSITTGPRQSNFELLRLLLMLMILILHANFPFGTPGTLSSFKNVFMISIDAFFICAVNCFVMISGWFSIKVSARGFMNFLFQCCYFATICLLFNYFYNGSISLKEISTILLIGKYHWFAVSYIGLYILSPLLNYFCEKASKSQLLSIIIFFIIFQVMYGWFIKGRTCSNGFSAFSFLGLYLIARYFHLHYRGGKSWKNPLLLYLLCCSIAFISYPILKFDLAFKYTNPIIIISAISLLLCFSRIKIKPNRIINQIAKSAFAVYLLHQGLGTLEFYNSLFSPGSPIFQYSGIAYIAITLGIILLWYAAGIILDQPRRWLWKRFGDRITCSITYCWDKFISRLSTAIS